MIPWILEFHANPDGTGAFVDADAGGDPVITIFLSSNSNIIVAATTMTHVSTGVYEYDQTGETEGFSYYATWVATVNGETISQQVPWTKIAGGDAWYYSNRAGVATVLDADDIRVSWDMNGDGTEDPGLMVSDGITADGYIDLYLANEGVTVPVNLTTAAAHAVKALADVSNHLTVWYGWTHRGLEELSNKTGRSSADIAGLMSGYKTYADEQLEKIATIILGSTTGMPAATGMLTAIVGPPKQYPGTGCVRPAAVNLNSGVASW